MTNHDSSRVRQSEPSLPFDAFAGTIAILVGAAGLLYSAAFVVNAAEPSRPARLFMALSLMLGGLGATAVVVALYTRLRLVSFPHALLALLLGFAAAIGSAVHGGYDLANVINKPDTTLKGLPNPVDPRGLVTFGLSALAVLLFSWLMLRGGVFPSGLGRLGYALGVLLLILYCGRLIIVDSGNPLIVAAALLAGVVANPAWYIWIGRLLRLEE